MKKEQRDGHPGGARPEEEEAEQTLPEGEEEEERIKEGGPDGTVYQGLGHRAGRTEAKELKRTKPEVNDGDG